ncbi:hypothetical protein ACLKA7_008194 [Drosophila subpalustris]
MPDSGDCSDAEMNQPSCSRKSVHNKNQNNDREKRNRRIIMRIEFNDSEDTDADDACSVSSNGNAVASTGVDLDTRPSCSSLSQLRRSGRSRQLPHAIKDVNSSGATRRSARQSRRRRDNNSLHMNNDVEPEGCFSSSGSEIDERITKVRDRGKRLKVNISEDEQIEGQEVKNDNSRISALADCDVGAISDSSNSSSNELLEKCPICLLTFRQQEIGKPVTCEHSFCAACIEAWAKNVQTCPIDRLEFDKIIVLDNFERRNVVREVRVDLSSSKKELVLDDDDNVAVVAASADEVTNCEICNSPDREDIMLLCDSCNQGYHMDCLDPPLFEIPEGSWYCDNCIDSNDEDEDEALELAEDLNMLYEDLRGMGLPETRLRVRQVQQPRILRTRQNERIRAAVLRHTRTSSAAGAQTETTTTTRTTTRRNRSSTTTRTSTSTTTTRRGRSRRTRHRTYVVEYDLNNFDEKFAVKTSKKVIRRRRRRKATRRTRSQAGARSSSDGVRMTASKRLAEQLGVKIDGVRGSHISGGSASSFTLFGNANDLEYFSDSDDVREDFGAGIAAGHLGATAVQTSVRIGSIGTQRNRKALLGGKARTAATTHGAASDILSSILDMQDRWHGATRNLSEVHINADGSLNLPQRKPTDVTKSTTEHITQAPLYQRGGAGPNFGRGGGGNYNNRYSGNNSNNNNNYRGGGGGGGSGNSANQYQRHSTGGIDNTSNQSFNSNNNNNNNASNTNFTPFNMRFNAPNQQQQKQQQQQQQQQRNQNMPQSRQSPSSYSASSSTATPSTSFAHSSFPQQPQRQLFSGLPAPVNAPPLSSRMSMPQVFTVPPPPKPPRSLSWNTSLFKLNTDYGNKPNTDKDDEDDDDNCPNFSIYSQESQAVATELFAPQTAAKSSDKDDDEMNEDLVQLDDDEDIPLPPEPQAEHKVADANEDCNAGSDLYEPENPTEEQDEDQDEMVAKPVAKEEGETRETSNPASDPSPSHTPAAKEPDDDDEETKTRSTPSPTLKDARTVDRGKGVLELYDDSDWEELDIDKPKEFEKALVEETTVPSPVANNNKATDGGPTSSKTSGSEPDPERSYTPCLDEKTLEEEAASGQQADKPESDAKKNDGKKTDAASGDEDDDEDEEKRVEGMGTELISEDENLTNENESKRRSRSRSRSRSRHRKDGGSTAGHKSRRSSKRGKENAETFKKVGKRRKDRNYRGDKQQRRSRSRKSHSKTPRSGTRSLSRSRSRSRIRSRSRSRSRSPHPHRSRSLSKSPRGRRRSSRSRSYSRSRSNSAGRQRSSFRGREHGRGFVRGRGGGVAGGGVGGGGSVRFSYRNQQQFQSRGYQHSYHNQQQYPQQQYPNSNPQQQNQYNSQQFYQRPKRRELPRYDVRNVVSASRHQQKDRYGRDAARSGRSRSITFERRQPSRSFSRASSRGTHSRSASPKRFRSFSISPSPPAGVAGHHHHHEPGIRRRSLSPIGRRFNRSPSTSQLPQNPRRNSPLHQLQRSHSPISLRSRSNTPARLNGGRNLSGGKHSPVYSPRYTPRLSRSRSKSPRKKKKKKSDKKKKSKKRPASSSPVGRHRRISRQRDPFDDDDDFLAPQLSKKSKKSTGGMVTTHWSPSPTPSLTGEHMNFLHGSAPGGGGGGVKPGSWTPPLTSPRAPGAHYTENPRRSLTPVIVGKKVKTKRDKSKKKKKPLEKQRKEKKRKRHTLTPEPIPSKEVFASGNNILVSVSFNKEANSSALAGTAQQQTVVTLPPTRDEFLIGRRTSIDRLTNNSSVKKSKRKRKKLDAKPVAIIDLERSPFQVHQEPADVIVLTDSEDANENQLLMRRERRRSSVASATDHQLMRENGQREKTPTADLETIMETSYENLNQTTGPKTPPEPHLVKFNLPAKKQHKVRNNPLHDDADDIHSADEMETVCSMRNPVDGEPQQPHVNDGLISTQKIGPNTPPESGPCSPDAYDPFEPTKSPSLSPRSPTPTPAQNLEPMTLQTSTESGGPVDKIDSLSSSQKHNSHSDEMADANASTSNLSGSSNANAQTNANVINPVGLVMALMSKSSNSIQQELANKSCDVSSTQYMSSTAMSTSMAAVSCADDKPTDNANTITVLSNVLLSSSTVVSASQHIPVISSPPTTLARKLTTLPKTGGSVASSSSGIGNMPTGGGTLRNGNTAGVGGASGGAAGGAGGLDDSFNMDIESPYSPGSADYEDLFEPPPDGNAAGGMRRSKGSGKTEMFDNLFGSSSPVGQIRQSSRFNNAGGRKQQRANNKNERKSKAKGSKVVKDHGKLYDDVPNSAVDQQNNDRFMTKLNRQERVVEEVKLVLKPHFNKKVITKEDYKDIMRRAVPKICHSRSGEINPHKIKNLIDAYVKKFRAKHKNLSLLNTGQGEGGARVFFTNHATSFNGRMHSYASIKTTIAARKRKHINCHCYID